MAPSKGVNLSAGKGVVSPTLANPAVYATSTRSKFTASRIVAGKL